MIPYNIPKHDCKNCGECCGVIPCTPSELSQIQNYVKKNKIKPKIQTNMTCPFRNNKDHKCNIYPVRPMMCRLMGVVIGMTCKHGNSHQIDGSKFFTRSDNILTLNHEFRKER